MRPCSTNVDIHQCGENKIINNAFQILCLAHVLYKIPEEKGSLASIMTEMFCLHFGESHILCSFLECIHLN